MAKAKTTKKTTKKAKVEVKTNTAVNTLRKGALAYVGLYGAAYEAAKTRFETARNATDGLFDSLVEKGESIETAAVVLAKGAQLKATETFTTSTEKVRGVLPTASNDRVEELESEITKLNKKIAAMAKKKSSTKKASVKTQKTAPYTQTSLNKMLEADLVALANDLGIEASVDDLKADTVAKVLAKVAAPKAA